MRKTKGISLVVTAMLLVMISIALAVGLWIYAQRYTKGGSPIQAQLNVISNRYINNVPVYTLSLLAQSKSVKTLQIVSIKIIGTTSSGKAMILTISNGNQTIGASYSASVSPSLPYTINPNSQTELALTIAGNNANVSALASVSVQITLKNNAGNTYTVQTNAVQLG